MEFPSLGVHCAVGSCSKLDFLPFECDCCHQIFCQEHRSYEDHNCTESYIKDVHIPVCPLCNKPITTKKGEDPNIKVNEHIMRDCEEQKKKLYTNKCAFPGCKKKELVPMICSKCHQNYCIKHRIETDHHCQERPLTIRSKSSSSHGSTSSRQPPSTTTSSNRKPQSSLMSQIGADLNRERMERQIRQSSSVPSSTGSSQIRQSSGIPSSTGSSLSTKSKTHESPNTLTPLINGDMTDDEALAIALATSVSDQQSTTTIHQQTTTTNSKEMIDEDEALAQAIAASLNDTTKSPSSSGQSQTTSSTDKSNCIIS